MGDGESIRRKKKQRKGNDEQMRTLANKERKRFVNVHLL